MKQASQQLTDLARSTAEPMGYELVGVELISRGAHGKTLRVYIDQEAGITVDDCARFSHQFSGVLDVEDPVKGNYDLEVSSPGLDRPLFELHQFAAFVGRQVSIQMLGQIEGRRKFIGEIVMIEESDVILDDAEGNRYRLSFDEMERARLVPDFG